MLRLGVVSFLNARPLIEGLAQESEVRCLFDVPAALSARLDQHEVDVALVPVIDVLRHADTYRVVSDACIGSDGETMTVRVFSHVPPHRVRTLHVDPDSHTSVALARLLWQQLFDCELTLRPRTSATRVADNEGLLLIGDKVVDPGRDGFGYEVDLGGAWRQHTGLPFVFAVWARRLDGSLATPDAATRAAARLERARDRGVAVAAQIADRDGPTQGWPVDLARRYLTRCLTYRLDARAVEGADCFARLCTAAGLVPAWATRVGITLSETMGTPPPPSCSPTPGVAR